jgi:hypothetical protein
VTVLDRAGLLVGVLGLLVAGLAAAATALVLSRFAGHSPGGRLDLRSRGGLALLVFVLAVGAGLAWGVALLGFVAYLLWSGGAAAVPHLNPLRLALASLALALLPWLMVWPKRRRLAGPPLTRLVPLAAGLAVLGLLTSLFWALLEAMR